VTRARDEAIARMDARRTLTIRERVLDRRFARDVERLLPRERARRDRLPPAAGAPAIPGIGRATAAELPQGGQGIASPLTEQSRTTSIQTLPIEGTDGEVDVERIETITFRDAQGRDVAFILDHPT
jgi:hypothetical protein